MIVLNEYIEFISHFIEQKRGDGTPVIEYIVPSSEIASEIRPLPGNTLLLKNDTAVELGHPTGISTFFALCGDESTRVENGKITLIGKDLDELIGTEVPLGIVIIARFKSTPSVGLYSKLLGCGYVGGEVPGFLVRAMSGRYWCRVSWKAVKSGLTLFTLGSYIIKKIKINIPDAESASLLFITSSDKDVLELSRIGEHVEKAIHHARRESFMELYPDEYRCLTNQQCSICQDEKTCSEIRKIFRLSREVGE